MLTAAARYNVSHLIHTCCRYLQSHLDVHSVASVLHVSNRLQLLTLRKACMSRSALLDCLIAAGVYLF